MQRKLTGRLLMIAMLFAGSATIPVSAEAGGWRWARPRILMPRTRSVVRTSTLNRYPVRTIQSTPSRPRISGKNDWPGAIGFADPRYEFFQDANGYWK